MSKNSIIELVLNRAGVHTYAGASHNDPWSDEELRERFEHLFGRHPDSTVVLVDGKDDHFVVSNMTEVRAAHLQGFHGIMKAVVVPNDLLDDIRDHVPFKEIEVAAA